MVSKSDTYLSNDKIKVYTIAWCGLVDWIDKISFEKLSVHKQNRVLPGQSNIMTHAIRKSW